MPLKAKCRDGSALDYALDRMSACAPLQTGRARKSLGVLLRGLRASPWPEVAWNFSELTPDGFPVELTFSTAPGNTVRYALEVAGPEIPEQERVAEAFRVYQALAGRPASPQLEQEILQMQSGHELFYGAWFGGAHDENSDRYKIYAEIPKDAPLGHLLPALEKNTPLSHCGSYAVMFGFQPDTNVREVYFRAAGLAWEDIGKLLWSNGLGHRYQDTRELMEATCDRPGFTTALEGFSLAFDASQRVIAISLFAQATFLLGNDAHIRRHLLHMARSRNWTLPLYEKATALLQDREDLLRHQGVIAWIVSGHAPIELRIGLRPPEPPAEIQRLSLNN